MPPLLLLWTLTAAPDPALEGRFAFSDPGVGENGVACVACHRADREDEPGDGLLRAGHSLFGVAKRPYWRGDARRSQFRTLGQAIDVCYQLFQGGATMPPRTKQNLEAYLSQISPRPAPPVQIQPGLEATLDYDRDKYNRGEASRGRTLFYRACHGCHPHGGAGVAPAIFGKSVPEVALKVREGNGLLRGKKAPGAWSPFYGKDRLSDAEVADLAAYVQGLTPRTAALAPTPR